MNDTISGPAHALALCVGCGSRIFAVIGDLFPRCHKCRERAAKAPLQAAMPTEAEMAAFDRDHEGDRFDGLD